MAGDWLKFEINTPEKREVLAMSVELGYEDPDLTVGKLLRVWRWFDQHTVNGNALNVTPALFDRLISVKGITQAMVNVGWLIVNSDGLTLPNFERHNGKTAKARVLTAVRVANHKDREKSNAPIVSSALPREVKRSKDINTITPDGVSDSVFQDFIKLRKGLKAPVTETAINGLKREADKAHLPLQTVLELCCQNGWRGFKAEWIKADATASNQLRGFVNA
jgi:hypothetical protein